MLDPRTIRITTHTWRYHLKGNQWRSNQSQWRIGHDDREWYAVHLATRETIRPSTGTLRQLQAELSSRIQQETQE